MRIIQDASRRKAIKVYFRTDLKARPTESAINFMLLDFATLNTERTSLKFVLVVKISLSSTITDSRTIIKQGIWKYDRVEQSDTSLSNIASPVGKTSRQPLLSPTSSSYIMILITISSKRCNVFFFFLVKLAWKSTLIKFYHLSADKIVSL